MNSEMYEGEYLDNKKHGDGSFTYDGGLLVCSWDNDLQLGLGVLHLSNGESIECNWDCGVPTGEILQKNDDRVVKICSVKEDFEDLLGLEVSLKRGKESLTLSDDLFKKKFGSVCSDSDDLIRINWRKTTDDRGTYEGQMTDTEYNGHGTLSYPDGSTYPGSWKDSKKHGYGVLKWPSGDFYEGEFRHDMRSGRGKAISVAGFSYEGSWEDNKRQGFGVYVWPSGNRYEGEFRHNLFEGRATKTYAPTDGSVYTGEIVLYGVETCKWWKGDVYEGEYFKDGERDKAA
jgi:hypothetical protein